jgi:hypothetical protein
MSLAVSIRQDLKFELRQLEQSAGGQSSVRILGAIISPFAGTHPHSTLGQPRGQRCEFETQIASNYAALLRAGPLLPRIAGRLNDTPHSTDTIAGRCRFGFHHECKLILYMLVVRVFAVFLQ